jgi:hypothetical protein
MGDPKGKPAPKPTPAFDVIGDVTKMYKKEFTSPWKFLIFLIFLFVISFIYWLAINEENPVLVQTYFVHNFGQYLPLINTIATGLTVVLTAGLVYIFILTREINDIEYYKYASNETKQEETKQHHAGWQVVENLVESDSPNDWRIAIMEADGMLEDATRQVKGRGETLGERLKSLNPNNFKTLQSAWDAHKVRNILAHGGMSYDLSQREARRVIGLYEKVLTEFKYF